MPTLYCPACGYNLTGLPENRCPECGRPFDPGALSRRYTVTAHPVTLTEVIVRCAALLIMFWVVCLLALSVSYCLGSIFVPLAAAIFVALALDNARELARGLFADRATGGAQLQLVIGGNSDGIVDRHVRQLTRRILWAQLLGGLLPVALFVIFSLVG